MKNNKMYMYLGLAMLVAVIAVAAVLLPNMGEEKESARNDKSMQKPVVVRHAKKNETPRAVPSITKNEEKRETDSAKNHTNDDVTQEAEETSVTQYNFHGGSKLTWPVKGNVIINFDQDHLVYFSTLDEYRYSNAIAIEAKEGTQVKAAAAGEVISIDENTEHGLCVTMRIGPEYEITYGQLKDCNVKVGQNVKREEAFAKVAKVSPQFEDEGDNLYLCLKRDKDYENPLSYLDFSE